MKVFIDPRVRSLFQKIALCTLLWPGLFGMLFLRFPGNAPLFLCASSFCTGLSVLLLCWRYFREQERILEEAAAQIAECILDGQRDGIECGSEGAMYRLFHEVNSLVSIVNAHADGERRAKEFLRNIITDISHQLKTPIAALNIYNGILQQEKEDFSTIHEFAALSEQELDRMETLVQNLLKIARLDAGVITLEPSEENLAGLLEGVARSYAFRAEQEEKQILLNGSERAVLLCDRAWLSEAIGNVVKNALDHTEKGDCVFISWNASASLVQIMIRDTGSGIHPEDLYHIFKRFYRSRFSKDTQGAGLGLPLAKAVVEAHQGSIEVSSQLGSGTTFTINFLVPTKL